MNVVIITPPLVQLNTPYPSGAYLQGFFKKPELLAYVRQARGTAETAPQSSAQSNGTPNDFASAASDEPLTVQWADLSIELFHAVFSPAGLTRIFAETGQKALAMAQEAEAQDDDGTAFNLRRYVSQAQNWVNWITPIKAMLGCSDCADQLTDTLDFDSALTPRPKSGREYVHEFVRSAHAPRGERMERYLQDLGRDVTADDTKMLATLALADVADYLSAVYDPHFSLIRYAEQVSASDAPFAAIEEAAQAPTLRDFYAPLVERWLRSLLAAEGTTTQTSSALGGSHGWLFLVSVPFAGTFASALATCRSIRAIFGANALISLGGGYVNTALRSVCEPRLAHYADFLSYDRGYAFYADLCAGAVSPAETPADQQTEYNLHISDTASTKQTPPAVGGAALTAESASKAAPASPVVPATATAQDAGIPYGGARLLASGAVYTPSEQARAFEERCTRTVTPDYTGISFARYPRLADDANPMHRIWSDGAWLKAYLAHGCYWHRCSFCDTTLDYVCHYRTVDVPTLHRALLQEARKTGVYGVHFVDEAAPPVALERLALLNMAPAVLAGTAVNTSPAPAASAATAAPAASASARAACDRLTFWGNIRFEKAFTRDLADLLAYGGLTGVSGGIEVASNDGLLGVNKGIDVASVVSSCCAFKEAGILVHAYMIFGFYDETPEQLVNSLETLRQLFAAGLLDSAFYHKFSLTEHSSLYREWRGGKHPGLHPVDPPKDAFARYELHFKEEAASEKYRDGVQNALSHWMHGSGLEKSVSRWFPFPMPHPTVPKNLVQTEITRYEERTHARNREKQEGGTYVWLGGKPLVVPASASGANGACVAHGGNTANTPRGATDWQLCYTYMGELLYVDIPRAALEDAGTASNPQTAAEELAAALWNMRPAKLAQYAATLPAPPSDWHLEQPRLPAKLFRHLRGHGLARL